MNDWSNPDLSTRGSRRAGFTLIELLVVIIISLLAALALPAFAGSKGRTKIGQCASNLKQFGLAMQLYGSEHDGRLPTLKSGAWAWEIPWDIGTMITRYGATRQVLYCPGTAPRFTDADNNSLFNFTAGSFRVIGYATTFQATSSLIVTNVNRTLTPESVQLGLALKPPDLPGQRVLLADATMSASGQNSPANRFSYNYISIQGGYTKPHLSPHLSNRIPVGGNVAMLDGHVEWRPFAEMFPRTTGGAPVFWW